MKELALLRRVHGERAEKVFMEIMPSARDAKEAMILAHLKLLGCEDKGIREKMLEIIRKLDPELHPIHLLLKANVEHIEASIFNELSLLSLKFYLPEQLVRRARTDASLALRILGILSKLLEEKELAMKERIVTRDFFLPLFAMPLESLEEGVRVAKRIGLTIGTFWLLLFRQFLTKDEYSGFLKYLEKQKGIANIFHRISRKCGYNALFFLLLLLSRRFLREKDSEDLLKRFEKVKSQKAFLKVYFEELGVKKPRGVSLGSLKIEMKSLRKILLEIEEVKKKYKSDKKFKKYFDSLFFSTDGSTYLTFVHLWIDFFRSMAKVGEENFWKDYLGKAKEFLEPELRFLLEISGKKFSIPKWEEFLRDKEKCKLLFKEIKEKGLENELQTLKADLIASLEKFSLKELSDTLKRSEFSKKNAPTHLTIIFDSLLQLERKVRKLRGEELREGCKELYNIKAHFFSIIFRSGILESVHSDYRFEIGKKSLWESVFRSSLVLDCLGHLYDNRLYSAHLPFQLSLSTSDLCLHFRRDVVVRSRLQIGKLEKRIAFFDSVEGKRTMGAGSHVKFFSKNVVPIILGILHMLGFREPPYSIVFGAAAFRKRTVKTEEDVKNFPFFLEPKGESTLLRTPFIPYSQLYGTPMLSFSFKLHPRLVI